MQCSSLKPVLLLLFVFTFCFFECNKRIPGFLMDQLFLATYGTLCQQLLDFTSTWGPCSRSTPFSHPLYFPPAECLLCTYWQIKAYAKHCWNPSLINKQFHDTLQALTSSQSRRLGTRFGLSPVCRRCSWPSLSSLPSHGLQATGSGATCHFGSMDTPAHPPVHSLVTRRDERKKGEGVGVILGGWWADSE